MFKFKLESLLKYKQGIEDKKQTEVKLAEMELLKANNIQADHEIKKESIIMQIQKIQKSTVDPIKISVYQKFVMELNKKISYQQNHINTLRQTLETKQKELISAMQERKILEKLKEKEKKTWNKKISHREEKEFDNLNNATFYKLHRKAKSSLFLFSLFILLLLGAYVHPFDLSLHILPSVYAQSLKDPTSSRKATNAEKITDTESEQDIFLKKKEKHLLDIEKKLEAKEALLNEREARLDEIKKDINLTLDQKIEELETLKAVVNKAIEERKNLKKQQVTNLAKLYEGATPEQASSIIEKLDPKIAAQLFLLMNKRNAGKIWGFVNPNIAVKITKYITKERDSKLPF